MSRSHLRPVSLTTACALAALAVLAGCQKTTTTTETPSGTTTTTTAVEPTAQASAAASEAGNVLTDAAITAKVKIALLADPDVKGLQIDVDTKDGAVTLNGNADSQANLDKATTIAKGIDGVKSVDTHVSVNVAPAGTMASSAATTAGSMAATAGAMAASAGDSAGHAMDKAGDSTRDALDKAGDATRNGMGKAGDATRSAVDKAGDTMGDAALTAKVKTALLADSDVKGLKIDVDTKDGVVTLSGEIDQKANVEKAETIAKGIDGVKSVDNRLTAKAPS